jgi:hypothetical protein
LYCRARHSGAAAQTWSKLLSEEKRVFAADHFALTCVSSHIVDHAWQMQTGGTLTKMTGPLPVPKSADPVIRLIR